VFLFGGVDGNNVLVPLDSAGYGQYSAVRSDASGINLGQDELLPIAPVNVGTPFGLPSVAARSASAVRSGTRCVPRQRRNPVATRRPRTDYTAGDRPDNLYSHSDQQARMAKRHRRRGIAHRLGRTTRRRDRALAAADVSSRHVDCGRYAVRHR
jgi:uncharacterized protein (DUF1501 family)